MTEREKLIMAFGEACFAESTFSLSKPRDTGFWKAETFVKFKVLQGKSWEAFLAIREYDGKEKT